MMSGATMSALVTGSLDALGYSGRVTGVRRSGGGSGADVFRPAVDGRRLVLKVTTDERWPAGARREHRVHTDLADVLDGRIPTVLATDDDGSVVRILLLEYESGSAAALLGVDDWRRVADELGRLHRSGPPSGWLTGPDGPATMRWPAPSTGGRLWDTAHWPRRVPRCCRPLVPVRSPCHRC